MEFPVWKAQTCVTSRLSGISFLEGTSVTLRVSPFGLSGVPFLEGSVKKVQVTRHSVGFWGRSKDPVPISLLERLSNVCRQTVPRICGSLLPRDQMVHNKQIRNSVQVFLKIAFHVLADERSKRNSFTLVQNQHFSVLFAESIAKMQTERAFQSSISGLKPKIALGFQKSCNLIQQPTCDFLQAVTQNLLSFQI